MTMTAIDISESFYIPDKGRVKMGTVGVYIGPFSSIIADSQITIEDNVFISPSVTITNVDHYTGPVLNYTFKLGESLPITIEKNCWIGANSVILKGVHLGEGCVVGAGSVV